MITKLTLVTHSNGPIDLQITSGPSSTVGDLARYLDAANPYKGTQPTSSEAVSIRLGHGSALTLDPKLPLADSGLASGMEVTLVYSDEQPDARTAAAALVVVSVVAGPNHGDRFYLPAGTALISREPGSDVYLDDQTVSRPHARLTISDSIEVVDLGSASGLFIGGVPVDRATLKPGDHLQIGESTITVAHLSDPAMHRLPDRRHIGAFIRPPRIVKSFSGRAYFPFVSSHDSVPMASRSWRKARAEDIRDLDDNLNDLVAELKRLRAEEIASRNREYPSTIECVTAVRQRSDLIWSRRPGRPGFAELRLGTGKLPTRNQFSLPTIGSLHKLAYSKVMSAIEPFQEVEPVPLVSNLPLDGALGLCGQREVALRLARALVAQSAILHSPAELSIAAFASAESSAYWDWLKWLPHTSTVAGPTRSSPLSSNSATGTRLIGELEDLLERRMALSAEERGAAQPRLLVVVENDAPLDHSRFVYLAEHGGNCGIHVLWIASNRSLLPAACNTYVEMALDSGVALIGMNYPEPSLRAASVEQLDESTAIEIAKMLSPMVDASVREDDQYELPKSTSLLSLIGPEIRDSPEAVLERWSENGSLASAAGPIRRASGLRAVIGLSADGAYAVDLRADGPHALVGGTTGAGKSELLQTWILGLASAYSPQKVTFLLIDYKGGSAFRECVELPHAVGLVTDLSPDLVDRTLTSLHAELRYRESVFAQFGVKDLIEYERAGLPPLPSLVIVIDEFAALVAEIPEFLDGVVNIAQRGRSLGLHLILATQRPAGIIRDNLRANTNLRIALRMADAEDSVDVLNSPIASTFDPAIPGRAVSKNGPRALIAFQTAYVGGWSSQIGQSNDITVQELKFDSGRFWTPPVAVSPEPRHGQTDINTLVRTIRTACSLANVGLPRRPWLPELSAVYDLQGVASTVGDGLAFGVSDHPERQSQEAAVYQPDVDGNLLILGTAGSGKSTALRTIALSASILADRELSHIYGIDFGGRAIAMLADLPTVGSIIDGADEERITRLLTWLRDLIEERSARFAEVSAASLREFRERMPGHPVPRIILIIDEAVGFRNASETPSTYRLWDLLLLIARGGRSVGVHVIATAGRSSGLSELLSAMPARLILRLASPDEYHLMNERRPLSVTSLPGRALYRSKVTQIAVLGGDSDMLVQASSVARHAAVLRELNIQSAHPIGRLPAYIELAELPATVAGRPTLGISGETLSPLGFEPSGGFVVSGPPGSGRSTAIRAMRSSLERLGRPITCHLISGRRITHDPAMGWDSEVFIGVSDIGERLEKLHTLIELDPADCLVVIVVAEAGSIIASRYESDVDRLLRACRTSGHFFVFEAESNVMMSSFGLVGLAKDDRAGLILQPDWSDGPSLLRTNLPRTNRADFPQGRGFLVARGHASLIQVATPGTEPAH